MHATHNTIIHDNSEPCYIIHLFFRHLLEKSVYARMMRSNSLWSQLEPNMLRRGLCTYTRRPRGVVFLSTGTILPLAERQATTSTVKLDKVYADSTRGRALTMLDEYRSHRRVTPVRGLCVEYATIEPAASR